MAKTIVAACIAAFFHRETGEYVKPGTVVELAEETFLRLEEAECVREAADDDIDKAPAPTPTSTPAPASTIAEVKKKQAGETAVERKNSGAAGKRAKP